MRPVELGGSIARAKDPAVVDALKEIERASAEAHLLDIAAAFTITGAFTERRELQIGVSTLTQTQEFIATFINDCKRGGANRST